MAVFDWLSPKRKKKRENFQKRGLPKSPPWAMLQFTLLTYLRGSTDLLLRRSKTAWGIEAEGRGVRVSSLLTMHTDFLTTQAQKENFQKRGLLSLPLEFTYISTSTDLLLRRSKTAWEKRRVWKGSCKIID